MGNCCSETHNKAASCCLDQLKVGKSSEFLDFYHTRKLELKNQGYYDLENDISKHILGILTSKYNISTNSALIWVIYYIDYMILSAFYARVKENPFDLSPPFAIETVLKIHALFGEKFEEFVQILFGPEYLFKYKPIKLTVSGNTEHYERRRVAYETAKKLIMENLYEDTTLSKDKRKASLAMGIWEDYDLTILKNEFNFYFLSSQDKQNFIDLLKSRRKLIELPSLSPYNYINVSSSLRISASLPVFNYYQEFQIPAINHKLKSKNGIDPEFLEDLDKFKFPSNFGRLICWEHMLTKQQATHWIYEYKKFLCLISINPEKTLCPSHVVEQVWHLHAQFVNNYRKMNKLLKLPYYPYKAKIEVREPESYSYTLELYKSYFGKPDPKIWPSSKPIYSGRYSNFFLAFSKTTLAKQNKYKNSNNQMDIASVKTDRTEPKESAKVTHNSKKTGHLEWDETDDMSFIFQENYEEMDVVCNLFAFDEEAQTKTTLHRAE